MSDATSSRAAVAEALEVASLRHGVQGGGGTFHIHRDSALAQKMVATMIEELAAAGFHLTVVERDPDAVKPGPTESVIPPPQDWDDV